MSSERTDVAALSAGAIAVAVSMAVVPGPFDAMGAIVAFSLMLIIFAYIWQNDRTILQSLAVSSLLGVISVPIFAFIAEFILSHDPQQFVATGDPVNCLEKGIRTSCKRGETRSSVYASWQIAFWFFFGFLVFVFDRLSQKKAL